MPPNLLTLQGCAGLIALCALAWVFSTNRPAVRWRRAVIGIVVQIVLAWMLTRIPVMRCAFSSLNDAVTALQRATEAGTTFVFGFLGGGTQPFDGVAQNGYVLAFRALPMILVLSALTALFSYWRVLPAIVRGFAWVLEKTFHIGGAVGLAAAANVFVGMIEAPLFVRPYLARLTASELFVLMCTGMATIAGTVLVLYAEFLTPVMPDAVSHLLIASIISVPAAITMAHILVPETESSTIGHWIPPDDAGGAIAAVASGAESGLRLCLHIAAMLIVMIALVGLLNAVLGAVLPAIDGRPISLERILGVIMAPLAWLIGIPWSEALSAGRFLGIKTVLNEFIAYRQFAEIAETEFSPRSRLIMVYAMSGFANIGSLGIMIGGLGTMIPERRHEVIKLGPLAILGGTLATLCTGAVIGLLEG